ncbi:rhomboid family intramembrane serine protease [Bacteroidia bacterium]|nr:rhomboid family intramembrane serine protease [Bacteroidia bacterium]
MFNFIIRLIDSIVWPLLIVVVIWLVFFMNLSTSMNFNSFGMHPKEIKGLYGIFTMIFLHGDFDHLFSNSVPLLLSMGFIFIYFEKEKLPILLWNVLFTGILLIFMGKQGSTHIGASGVVYAYVFFLVTHAFFTKNKEMLAAAFVLIFLYGGLIYGLFPEFGKLIGKNISWEGHLSGAISGVLTGFIYRKKGPQQALFFVDEDDDENDDEMEYWNLPEEDEYGTTVNYHFKEKK